MVIRGAKTYFLLAVVFALAVAGAGRVLAHGEEDHAPGRVEMPTEHMAVGDTCVEDTEFMRRNHMTLLMHQRDKTVHQGERPKKHSLRNCLSCHAPAHPPGGAEPASIKSGKHFCAECHIYAAVKIDCFECHAEIGEAE